MLYIVNSTLYIAEKCLISSKNNKNGRKGTTNYWFMQQNVTKFCQNFHFANLTLQKVNSMKSRNSLVLVS